MRGALLQLPITNSGQCMVKPDCVGLVTEVSVALLLLEQPETEIKRYCSCHAADLRLREPESRIIITDSEGRHHVFRVQTTVLQEMLQLCLLYELSDGVSCTRLQGTILKSTQKGNARAAMIRRLGLR